MEICLKERFFYVTVNGTDSYIKETWFGVIQCSILGPILYAIFISPLFMIENLTCYADDKFSLVEDNHSMEWIELDLNQILTSQQTTFSVPKTKNTKVGLKIFLVNRLSVLNGRIPLGWLNGSLESFKVKCKNLLL